MTVVLAVATIVQTLAFVAVHRTVRARQEAGGTHGFATLFGVEMFHMTIVEFFVLLTLAITGPTTLLVLIGSATGTLGS